MNLYPFVLFSQGIVNVPHGIADVFEPFEL